MTKKNPPKTFSEGVGKLTINESLQAFLDDGVISVTVDANGDKYYLMPWLKDNKDGTLEILPYFGMDVTPLREYLGMDIKG